MTFGNQTFAWWVGKIGKVIIQGSKTHLEKLLESGVTILYDEEYNFEMEHIYVKPESYIFQALNDFVLHWHEHGFSKLFQSLHLPGSPEVIEDKDPKTVLTMHMLSAGFYLWLISIAIASLVFLSEHVVRYFLITRHLHKEMNVMHS